MLVVGMGIRCTYFFPLSLLSHLPERVPLFPSVCVVYVAAAVGSRSLRCRRRRGSHESQARE